MNKDQQSISRNQGTLLSSVASTNTTLQRVSAEGWYLQEIKGHVLMQSKYAFWRESDYQFEKDIEEKVSVESSEVFLKSSSSFIKKNTNFGDSCPNSCFV